jgi:anti-anti-sigma regulatory factor
MEGELDGFGFFDLVKRTMPSVPVIIVTGRLDDGQLRSYRSRAQGFLAKPFEIDKLEQTILRAVGAVTRLETPVEIKGGTVIFNSAVPPAEAEQTHRRLLQLLSSGFKTITLDLSRFTILHSGIAGLVVSLSSEAGQRNITVQIVCPEAIRRVFETTGIQTLPNVKFLES